MIDSTSQPKVLSVSELNRLAREVLQTNFPLFWVSGEVSNFTHAASGHWYFSLKDSSAQVRCVMFKGRNSYTDFTPREGDKIEARATVSLYEARGEFQLTIESIRQSGLGALFEAFERLKNKLEMEGLFNASLKQSIPAHPKSIGIVTSPDAAALRDVLTTLNRRNPNIKIIIYPTPVQGKGAAERIATAIRIANQRQEVDTLIICRGGGSIEDLWQFNEEVVARAIATCTIPVISGVGHETDFSICDFTADVRAATPTAAAEIACQDINHLVQKIKEFARQLERLFITNLQQRSLKLDFLAQRLVSPKQKIAMQIDYIKQLQNRLNYSIKHKFQLDKQYYNQLRSSIEQLSPSAVLSRGYAIVSCDQEHITDSKQLKIGQSLHIQLHIGEVDAAVTKKS
ncbi:MAG TPA: exodeoxyribonuclease VII large subunit [Methylophilaceae bacterium]|nr:exodeoxyribonuclease VII large subunit [Methylophilaceae bacterium]